jgi:hypothetical protein
MLLKLLYPLSQNGCYTHGPSHKPRMPLRLPKARRYYAKRGRERYPLESGLENAQGLGMAEAMIS